MRCDANKKASSQAERCFMNDCLFLTGAHSLNSEELTAIELEFMKVVLPQVN